MKIIIMKLEFNIGSTTSKTLAVVQLSTLRTKELWMLRVSISIQNFKNEEASGWKKHFPKFNLSCRSQNKAAITHAATMVGTQFHQVQPTAVPLHWRIKS